MGMPAARLLDTVTHPLPGMLSPGPGSFNVIIGGKPAWRGLPQAMAMALRAAQQVSDVIIKTAEGVSTGAAGTPGAPAALAAESVAKAAATTALTALMNGMGAACAVLGGTPDQHMCMTLGAPSPAPHGPGMVIDGSNSVLTNGLPQCAQADNVLEALGGMDPIMMGEPTVLIGKGAGAGMGPGGLFAALAAAIKGIVDKALAAVDAAVAFAKDAAAFVKGLVNAVIDGLKGMIARFTQAVVDAVTGALKSLAKAISDAFAAAKEAIRPSRVKGMDKVEADKAIEQAQKDATEAVDRRIKQLDEWNPETEKSFKEWFGDTDPATRAKMRERLVKTRDKLSGFGLDNYESDDDAYAYVYPDKDDKMYLGEAFGKAKPTGRDSKAGTLVHEASHYETVGGTDDVEHDGGKTYGANAARKLAKDNPAEAQHNADNFEYFVEDGM